jgi:hypothetical protein
MGLLEDAIREHLELKRLRGADPAAVAREQREALDAPTREAPGELVEDHAAVGEDGANTGGHAPEAEPPAGEGHPGDVPQAPVTDELSHAAQETAELDMESVMAEEPAMADELAPKEHGDIADAERVPPRSRPTKSPWNGRYRRGLMMPRRSSGCRMSKTPTRLLRWPASKMFRRGPPTLAARDALGRKSAHPDKGDSRSSSGCLRQWMAA